MRPFVGRKVLDSGATRRHQPSIHPYSVYQSFAGTTGTTSLDGRHGRVNSRGSVRTARLFYAIVPQEAANSQRFVGRGLDVLALRHVLVRCSDIFPPVRCWVVLGRYLVDFAPLLTFEALR